jgi:hypothetical protein
MRRKARLLVPVLMVGASCALATTIGGWLPLLALPWLLVLTWWAQRDPGDAREFPSAAEASRARLWLR